MDKFDHNVTEVEPNTPAQIAAMRCLAIVTGSLALGGFIVWYGLGGSETYPEMAASIARHSSDERYLFSETSHGMYVALPPGAVAGTLSSRLSIPASTTAAGLATPPLPKAKPLQVQAMSTTPVRSQKSAPVETTADVAPADGNAEQTTAADTSVDAAYQPERAEAVHEPSTLDAQMSPRPAQSDVDEAPSSEPTPTASDDEPAWQTSAPAEGDAEPSWDEAAPDEPADEPDSDPET